jgi:archaeal flagellin FlaB
VLTAFVVVAAVFSYVVLGAGFTTSDTAKKTIDEGVKQTTSSVELAGDVIAKGTPVEGGGGTVTTVIVPLQLTAGQASVDIGDGSDGSTNKEKLVVSYADSDVYKQNVEWSPTYVGENDGDNLLEQHEKVQLEITVPEGSKLLSNAQNVDFRLEIKPNVGAVVPITRVIPAAIDKVMVLK